MNYEHKADLGRQQARERSKNEKEEHTQPGMEYFLKQVLTQLYVQYHPDSAIIL